MGPARRVVRVIFSPIQLFLRIEAAGGIVLLTATGAALVLANTGAQGVYHRAVGTSHVWIDDGAMTLFFVLVGLEIRRELDGGELRDLRRAAMPVLSALGGMLAAAATYAIINAGHAGAPGWGIPMSTDVAFAAGAVTLLGKRIRPAARIVLLARAVSDDILTIVVIAVFYAANVHVGWLVLAAASGGGVVGMARSTRRWAWALLPAALLWYGFWRGGVHPTLAGVVFGVATPPAQAQRLSRGLNWLVAFGIMPLFALANAGVDFAGAQLTGDAGYVFAGTAAALVVGKPLGVWGSSWLVTRHAALRPVEPPDASLRIVGLASGIGFTVGLFVAKLAFPPGPLVATATLGLLVGSGTAMLLTLAAGFTTRSSR